MAQVTTSGTILGAGGLTGSLADFLDRLGDSVEGILNPVGGTVDDVVDTIADLLRGSGDDTGGLLGNLFSNGLTGGGTGNLLEIGLLSDDAVLSLTLSDGTKVAVLPSNGGIVSIGSDGAMGSDGALLDLGGLLGPGGLLNLSGLVGENGVIDLNDTVGSVLDLLGSGPLDSGDFMGDDGKVDPGKFDVVLDGTAGRDNFNLTAEANTYVDGKADIDTVNMARSAEGMSIAVGGDAVTFADADTLYYFQDVERVSFLEGSVYFDTGVGENAGVAYRLYQATFDRTPDNDGVKYWVSQLDDGMTSLAVANDFINSTEFRQTYGNLDDERFVEEIYQNVLGREADASGEQYWVDYLNSGSGTRANVLLGFSESAENVELVGQAIADGYVVS